MRKEKLRGRLEDVTRKKSEKVTSVVQQNDVV